MKSALAVTGLGFALTLSALTPPQASAAPRSCGEVFAKEPGLLGRLLQRGASVVKESPFISMEGTKNNGELGEGMLPRGSALITSSGALAETGINAIIHAASGAMTKQGGHYEPTLQSIELAVQNSVRLAERHGYTRIAIPLIGGKIFLERIGVEGDVLAARIITSALEAQTSIELRFVAFADADVMTFKRGLDMVRTGHIPGLDDVARIEQGSLTDFNVHGARVIVNAANMEVQFGGGLSGMIAKATNDSAAIDAEAARAIRSIR